MIEQIRNNTPAIIGIVGFLFIVGYMPFFEQSFVYDEPHYLSNLQLIDIHGLGGAFIENLKGPAGPLYTYIHYIFSPLTHGAVIPTRLVNVFISLVIVLLLYKTLAHLNPKKKSIALLFFAIPMSFSTVSIALTEIPAMLFFTAFVLIVSKAITKSIEAQKRISLWTFALAGLLLSIAISGRQPYLVCIAGMSPLLFTRDPSTRKGLLLGGLVALLIPLYLFYHWQGIAPMIGRSIVRQELLSLPHFLLGLGYGAVTVWLLAPHFFFKPSRKVLSFYLASLPVLFVLNVKLDFGFLIMYSLVTSIIPESMWPYVSYFMASMLTLVGIYFVHTLVKRSLEHRTDMLFLSFVLSVFLILLTNISITHIFSTRYVFQAAPLYIILASYYYRYSRLTFVANILGVILGMVSIITYQ